MHYERYLFHQMNTNMHGTSNITNNKTTKQKNGCGFAKFHFKDFIVIYGFVNTRV